MRQQAGKGNTAWASVDVQALSYCDGSQDFTFLARGVY